jgi:hypothetical protein
MDFRSEMAATSQLLFEHQQLNDRAAETLRAAIGVVPRDPTLHCALADFEERDAAVARLELALRLVGEGPEDRKVPYMREMIERQIQLRK